MRFLLDQGLLRSTVGYLQDLGFESEHVGDSGLAAASDVTILSIARDRESIVITLDSDFHALLANSGAPSPSVIRIRLQGLKGEDVANIIAEVMRSIEEDLIAGAVATVTGRRLAVRRLPLKA